MGTLSRNTFCVQGQEILIILLWMIWMFSGSEGQRHLSVIALPSSLLKQFMITGFIKDFYWKHNPHLLAKGGCSSYGVVDPLTDFHKKFRMDAAKLNIGATQANAILKSMLWSYKNLGITIVDFKNFAWDIEQYIGKHDDDMIIQKFKDIREFFDKEFIFEY